MRPLAHYSVDGEATMPMHAVPLQRTSITGRAMLDRATIHHADVVPLLDTEYPDARAERDGKLDSGRSWPCRSMHDGDAYGAIFLWRREPGLFAPDQVALVETFATQAAIAIENVRQFRATQEALEQQTATSEILRVISQSQTDVQPVFDTIAANALRLCDADFSGLFRFDGELIHIGAMRNLEPERSAAFRTAYPCPPQPRWHDPARDPDGSHRACARHPRGPGIHVSGCRKGSRFPKCPVGTHAARRASPLARSPCIALRQWRFPIRRSSC